MLLNVLVVDSFFLMSGITLSGCTTVVLVVFTLVKGHLCCFTVFGEYD